MYVYIYVFWGEYGYYEYIVVYDVFVEFGCEVWFFLWFDCNVWKMWSECCLIVVEFFEMY